MREEEREGRYLSKNISIILYDVLDSNILKPHKYSCHFVLLQKGTDSQPNSGLQHTAQYTSNPFVWIEFSVKAMWYLHCEIYFNKNAYNLLSSPW